VAEEPFSLTHCEDAKLFAEKLHSECHFASASTDWEDRRLLFVVREPFISRHSQASIVAGIVEPQQRVVLESLMPSGGVIFSDGIEADFLQFNSGTSVVVRAAESTAQLVVG
jgi:hypothetical protein